MKECVEGGDEPVYAAACEREEYEVQLEIWVVGSSEIKKGKINVLRKI